MKFGQQLELNTFPQWSSYYVRYRQIKNHINALFPSPRELQQEAQIDRSRATHSLLNLTDPDKAKRIAEHAKAHTRANGRNAVTAASSTIPESSASPSPSPSPSASTTPPGASPSPSPSASGSGPSSDDQADPEAEPLISAAAADKSAAAAFFSGAAVHPARSEKLPFNTNTRQYGSAADGASSDDESIEISSLIAKSKSKQNSNSNSAQPAAVQIQLNGMPMAGAAEVAAGASTAAAGSAPSSAPRPHLNRRVSGGSSAGFVASSRRFHPLAPQTHLEKMDQVAVKIMGELQKIDEFHRLMEAKIMAAFEGLKAQVAATREGDAAPEGISRTLKEMRHARSHHSNGQLSASNSSNSLAAQAEKEPLNGRSSSPSPEDTPEGHAVGHVRHHSGRVAGRAQHSHSQSQSREKQQRERERERARARSLSTSSSSGSSIDSIPLKAAFTQLLKRATMLIHFVDINFVAFAKLLKCFEKRAMAALKAGREGRDPSVLEQAQRMHKQLHTTVQNRSFYTSRKIDAQVVPDLYALYASLYEGGNVDKAKLVLLANLTEQEYSREDSFWLGLKVGCIGMLMALLCVILIEPIENMQLVHDMQLFAPVYRCVGLLVAFLWLWSFLVQIWDACGIPYVLMFQLNPRTRLTHFQLQTEAANLTIVYLLNSLLFLTHSGTVLYTHFSLSIYPFALFLFVLVKFFAPTRLISLWDTRSSLLHTLGQIAMAPFGKARFIESFVADVLTSMVKVFVDVEATFCLMGTYLFVDRTMLLSGCASAAAYVVPIICALPLWWRFQQCLRRYFDSKKRYPHVPNAFKYLLTHSVVIMAAYHPVFNDHHSTSWQTYRIVWLGCCVVSTLYSAWWDCVMDWGFFAKDSLWPGLRKDLMYGERAVPFYYFALVSNCLLRWVWVVTIIPFSFEDDTRGESNSPTTFLSAMVSYDQIIIPVLGLLELLRRFQWSIIRVEYEQIAQGTLLRVDPHLPIYVAQLQKTSAEKKAEQQEKMHYGVVSEVVGMVVCLLVIAVIAALS